MEFDCWGWGLSMRGPYAGASAAAGFTARRPAHARDLGEATANLPTQILDFTGCDSKQNIHLKLRGGVLMSIWNFAKSLSQAVLAGIISVWRLDVAPGRRTGEIGVAASRAARASSELGRLRKSGGGISPGFQGLRTCVEDRSGCRNFVCLIIVCTLLVITCMYVCMCIYIYM